MAVVSAGCGMPARPSKEADRTRRMTAVGVVDRNACNDILLHSDEPNESVSKFRTTVRMLPDSAVRAKGCHLEYMLPNEEQSHLSKGAGVIYAPQSLHTPLHVPVPESSQHVALDSKHAKARRRAPDPNPPATPLRDRSLYDELVARSRTSRIW